MIMDYVIGAILGILTMIGLLSIVVRGMRKEIRNVMQQQLDKPKKVKRHMAGEGRRSSSW